MQTIEKSGQKEPDRAQPHHKEPPKNLVKRAAPMARSMLRTSSQAYRGMTHGLRVMPDFIIIGGQRCGTSSLYYYLTEQHGIASAATKEVHFFDDFYDRGLDWYRAQFPTTAYKSYVENIQKRAFITGEASPYYIFHPNVPCRVAKVLPNIKIIALLRNPIDRAYSQHWLEVKGTYETLPFEEAIALEPERTAGEREKLLQDERYHSFAHRRYTYLARGIYIDQLAHWMNYFPREQFLILKTEDLYSTPAPVMRQALAFLGLPDEQIDTNKVYKKYKVPSKKGYRNKDEAPKMRPETRSALVEYFRPHNARLYAFLGRDLDWDR